MLLRLLSCGAVVVAFHTSKLRYRGFWEHVVMRVVIGDYMPFKSLNVIKVSRFQSLERERVVVLVLGPIS